MKTKSLSMKKLYMLAIDYVNEKYKGISKKDYKMAKKEVDLIADYLKFVFKNRK